MSTENQDQEVVTKKKRTTKATATKTSETTPAAETEPTENENSESVPASDQPSTNGVEADQASSSEQVETSSEGQQSETLTDEQASENTPAAEPSVSEQADYTSEGQQTENTTEQASDTPSGAETEPSVNETQVDEANVQGSVEQSPVNLSELPALLNIQNDQKLESSEPQPLSEFELEVTNNGRAHTCLVSNAVLPPGETVVIKYKTVRLKRLAATNFNQLNALAGKKRFELKEG